MNNAFYTHNYDQWDSFRNEGRIPLNIGFGLSLLDYDVNVVYHGWNAEPKKTWNEIILSKNFVRDHYDVALSFGTFNALSGLKFDRGVSIVYESCHIARVQEYERATGTEIIYVTTYHDLVDPMKSVTHKDVRYLPPLYPIPCYNIGFLPCSYSPELPILKIYLHYTSWPQDTTMSGDRFRTKEQLVIDHLKSKGYKIKLSVLVENRGTQCPITNEDITYYYSNECSYKDILDLMRVSDICITTGSSVFPGSGMTDIISMGKPLIYIGDGRLGVETKQNVSLLYKRSPENIVYLQEPTDESKAKIDQIMSNPLGLAQKYAAINMDQNFENWKKIVIDQRIFR